MNEKQSVPCFTSVRYVGMLSKFPGLPIFAPVGLSLAFPEQKFQYQVLPPVDVFVIVTGSPVQTVSGDMKLITWAWITGRGAVMRRMQVKL
jgi:hypothetical protein